MLANSVMQNLEDKKIVEKFFKNAVGAHLSGGRNENHEQKVGGIQIRTHHSNQKRSAHIFDLEEKRVCSCDKQIQSFRESKTAQRPIIESSLMTGFETFRS